MVLETFPGISMLGERYATAVIIDGNRIAALDPCGNGMNTEEILIHTG